MNLLVARLLRLVLVTGLTVCAASLAPASGPTITVWYGLNQSFGQLGNPQTAVNILGNVSDPNGVQSLSYTLNGGSSVALSRGPDTRRLLNPGDFNIDINTENLINGSNTVVITATNTLNQTSTQTVTVQYTAGNIWPGNYAIDWSTASSLQSVAQVVDGHWTLTDSTVRPTYLGYDRLIAIGDKLWTDYEVTVPIIFYSIDTLGGFGNPSNGPGVGLLFRWTGHTDDPLSGWQPKTGYLPLGAIAWYHWNWIDPNVPPRFELLGNNLSVLGDAGSILSSNVWYYFKMRVETVSGVGGLYKVKVWPVGQTEPSNWTLQGQQSLSDPQYGSVLLLSHHVDAEFGNVTVTQLAPPLPVQLASFTAHVLPNSAVRLDWMTLSEINNFGFYVQKRMSRLTEWRTLDGSFVPGHGTTNVPHYYTYTDNTGITTPTQYRLKQVDLDGTMHYSDPIEVSIPTSVTESPAPYTVSLEQNYPNPFFANGGSQPNRSLAGASGGNPGTRIGFKVQGVGFVSLKVYDVLGREVATLVDGVQDAGFKSVVFDGSNLPSGVYFYRLTAGGFVQTRKMILRR